MGILRRAELEGLHFGRAIRDWLRSSGGCRIVNLGARSFGRRGGTERGVSDASNLILWRHHLRSLYCENINKSVCFHSWHVIFAAFSDRSSDAVVLLQSVCNEGENTSTNDLVHFTVHGLLLAFAMDYFRHATERSWARSPCQQSSTCARRCEEPCSTTNFLETQHHLRIAGNQYGSQWTGTNERTRSPRVYSGHVTVKPSCGHMLCTRHFRLPESHMRSHYQLYTPNSGYCYL